MTRTRFCCASHIAVAVRETRRNPNMGDLYDVPRTSLSFLHMTMCTSVSSDSDASNSIVSVNTIGRPEFEFGMRTMPPPLAELLDANGCKAFLEALRKSGRLERASCRAITILAPHDDAFYAGIPVATDGLIL